jgi:predicted alpha/beta superfamily hydrolase
MRLLGLVAAAVLAAGPAFAQARVVSDAAYTAPGVQQLVVRSERLGRDFVVVVTPPASPLVPGMSGPEPGAKLPAVYALDGGYGVVGPIAQMLAQAGVSAPTYVVSISYPPGAGRRDTDFLFHPVTEGGRTYGGGGSAFLAFLTEELKPLLEARYPLDPSRSVLFGHSFGGLFAANVLVERPAAFSGYVIASASAWRDPGLTSRLREARPAEARVLVAAGGAEDARLLASTRDLSDALKGLRAQVGTEVFEGENHLSYYPKLAQAGLAWTLPSNAAGLVPTSISPEAMDRVAGVYGLADGRRATIERRGSRLIAALTGMPGETEILPQTQRRFFVPGGYDVVMTFDGEGAERATTLTVRMAGEEFTARRLDR